MEVPLLAFEATGTPLPTQWDVLAFTSATAVHYWSGPLSGFVAAVGPRTAEALGGRAQLVPPRALASALAEALGDLSGRTVCYPRAEVVNPAFEKALSEAGARVLAVPVYRTVLPDTAASQLAAALPVDLVALASGSAARHLAELGGAGCSVVCIGPSTEGEARRCGLSVAAVADLHTSEGLAAACLALLAAGPE